MKKTLIPQVIVIVMLLWALNPANPYAYYIILRWVCCGIFAYVAFQAFEQKKQGWVWLLGITALFYNPIFRIHLNRDLWSVVNVVTIGIAVASIFSFKEKKEKDDTDNRKENERKKYMVSMMSDFDLRPLRGRIENFDEIEAAQALAENEKNNWDSVCVCRRISEGKLEYIEQYKKGQKYDPMC